MHERELVAVFFPFFPFVPPDCNGGCACAAGTVRYVPRLGEAGIGSGAGRGECGKSLWRSVADQGLDSYTWALFFLF